MADQQQSTAQKPQRPVPLLSKYSTVSRPSPVPIRPSTVPTSKKSRHGKDKEEPVVVEQPVCAFPALEGWSRVYNQLKPVDSPKGYRYPLRKWCRNAGIKRLDDAALRRIIKTNARPAYTGSKLQVTHHMQRVKAGCRAAYMPLFSNKYYMLKVTLNIREPSGLYTVNGVCDIGMCVGLRSQVGEAIVDYGNALRNMLLDWLDDGFLQFIPEVPQSIRECSKFIQQLDDEQTEYNCEYNEADEEEERVWGIPTLVFMPVTFPSKDLISEEHKFLVKQNMELHKRSEEEDFVLPMLSFDKLCAYLTRPGGLRAFIVTWDISKEADPNRWKKLMEEKDKEEHQ